MGKPDFMFMLFWLLGLWPYVEGSYYYQRQIPNKCSFTRFPGLCVQTLVGFQSTKMERVHVVSALINKTISETKIPTSYFSQVHSQLVTVDTQESQRVRAVTGSTFV